MRARALALSRRALIGAGAALPFLRVPARAARAPGQLLYGLSTYPPDLHPWVSVGSAAQTTVLMRYRGLLGYDPQGRVRGELAESWEHDPKDDAWVFHLRSGVMFQNGEPVTSADVAWTIEQIAAPASTAYYRNQMQSVARVETPDPRTVRIVTKQPLATFPLLAAASYLSICQKGSNANGALPMGAGPFVLAGQEHGVSIDMRASDKYYKPGLPKLQSVHMTVYADENLRVAALQAGDVDLIEYVPWQSMGAIEANSHLRLQSQNGAAFMYLVFNGHAPHFSDKRIRLAVAHAVRREDIVKAAFFGRGATLAGVPIIPDTDFYDEKRAHVWDYDPAKAKALLAEAGVPNGFSCKLLATAQYSMHKDTAEVVQQHLAEIGIQVELVLPEWGARVNMGNRGQYEFAVMGTAAENNDPDGLTPVLVGDLTPSYGRSYGIDIPQIDQFMAQARQTFDTPSRVAIYDKMQDVAATEVPLAGLAWRSQAFAMKQEVQGFANMPGALTFYSGLTLEDTSVVAA
jgi:ABC-type transport system substrate-binding protein